VRKRQPIYIIADDLTGAADAANYFRTKHRRVRVSFSPSTPWMFSLGTNVVQVFDSESRVLDEDAAWRRVAFAGEQLVTSLSNGFFLFKKIDSTLRGHVGREIEALLKATGRTTAVLAPSFPANGRTVEDGKLLVGGVPITQTAFAKDPHNPVLKDSVAEIVRQTTSLPIVEITRDVIAQGREAIAEAIAAASHRETIVVADARTDADLIQIAQAIAGNLSVVPCGSAGLAKQLVALWDYPPENNGAEAIETTKNATTWRSSKESVRACERVLVVVGSANPVSHAQLEHAASALGAPTVELNPMQLGSALMHADEVQQAQQALEQLNDRPVVGVSLAKERAHRDASLHGTFEGDLAEIVIHGSIPSSMDGNVSVGFVATGGDTALALCQALAANAIWPEGEVVPGVPWSWIVTEYGQFPLVTKAGGFGNIDALQSAAEFLLDGSNLNMPFDEFGA